MITSSRTTAYIASVECSFLKDGDVVRNRFWVSDHLRGSPGPTDPVWFAFHGDRDRAKGFETLDDVEDMLVDLATTEQPFTPIIGTVEVFRTITETRREEENIYFDMEIFDAD